MFNLQINLEKYRPAKGIILGEVIDGNFTTDSGIVIVQNLKKQKPRKVRVIAVGGAFTNDKGIPQEYYAKTGDVAYFKMAEGKQMTINGKNYLFLENKDIVAVETEE
jgi:Co-chaperonin GroES (HSP10)